jgi:hypothetical protein
MPRSENYLLQSRSPSPPSPLTDLASPTIEAAPISSIEAQSQLCECHTRWQHDFFGCAYLFPFPSAQPSSSLRLALALLVHGLDENYLERYSPFSSPLLFHRPRTEDMLTTFQAPSTPLPASQTSLPHSQKVAPHGRRGTTSGPAT